MQLQVVLAEPGEQGRRSIDIYARVEAGGEEPPRGTMDASRRRGARSGRRRAGPAGEGAVAERAGPRARRCRPTSRGCTKSWPTQASTTARAPPALMQRPGGGAMRRSPRSASPRSWRRRPTLQPAPGAAGAGPARAGRRHVARRRRARGRGWAAADARGVERGLAARRRSDVAACVARAGGRRRGVACRPRRQRPAGPHRDARAARGLAGAAGGRTCAAGATGRCSALGWHSVEPADGGPSRLTVLGAEDSHLVGALRAAGVEPRSCRTRTSRRMSRLRW